MAYRAVALTLERLQEARDRIDEFFDRDTACEDALDDGRLRGEIRTHMTEPGHRCDVVQIDESGSWVAIALVLTRGGRIRRMYTRRKGTNYVDWLDVTAWICARLKTAFGEAYGHWDDDSSHLRARALADGRWAVLDPQRPYRVDWIGS